MKSTTIAFLVAALCCLPSCATSVRSYVERSTGYAVTKGEIRNVKHLHTDQRERLSDGVALTVSEPGCRVVMQFDERTRVIRPKQKSVLIYGAETDYLLEPYWPGDVPDGESFDDLEAATAAESSEPDGPPEAPLGE